jgi:hypothetical protein
MKGYKLGEDAGSKAVRQLGELEFSGNIIPNLWYHHLRTQSGPNLLAIVLLSEIVYWFRPIEVRHRETGMTIGWQKKFEAEWLQISQTKLGQKFGVDHKRVGRALDALEDAGVIRQKKLKRAVINGQNWGNVLFVLIVPSRLRQITYPNELSSPTPLGENRPSPWAESDQHTESINLLSSNSRDGRSNSYLHESNSNSSNYTYHTQDEGLSSDTDVDDDAWNDLSLWGNNA